MTKEIPDFSTGDIVENRYTSLRASVVCFITYPPELELILESGQTISAHADDWFVICPVHESLAMSSFNGRVPACGRETVHA